MAEADVVTEENVYREDVIEHRDAAPNGEINNDELLPVGPEGNIQGQMEEFLGPQPEYDEEEEEKKYYRRKRLGVIKNVLGASVGGMIIYSVYLGLLQMQLILHYDETYREVKYGSLGLEDIDRKMLMGINVTPIVGLLYTPVLIRFLGTKWMMFLASGIYALFVSTNYWERYYTLVPSAVAIGAAIVPLWASLGNYITRMAQQYYEYVNYKDDQVQEQKKVPEGAYNRYIIIFQSVLSPSCTHLSPPLPPSPPLLPPGAESSGMIEGFNKTVLNHLPRSILLIQVESVLMGAAFLSMIIFLVLCGPAYRPTEEIDLRSIGWGNIFQLPFKHLRDYRIRLLIPFFIYSGLETLFAVTGLTLSYGVCTVGLEWLFLLVMIYGLSCSLFSCLSLSLLKLPRYVTLLGGAAIHGPLLVFLFCWSPGPKQPDKLAYLLLVTALWGIGSALNKTGLSIILGMLYEDKERLDFVYTIYHWWQAIAIFVVYLWTGLIMRAKLSILLVTLLLACFCYWTMERRLAKKIRFRLPRIPRPKHKVKGYRYLEEENSDESDMEDSDRNDDEDQETLEELTEEARDEESQASDSPRGGARGRRRRCHDDYEQAGEGVDL
uniref:Unc-93 homolog B1, TLR signaling regulator n=1 Tax=Esox lucius TaxID=8010 RepID=A0A6Q2WYA4_ESOLU